MGRELKESIRTARSWRCRRTPPTATDLTQQVQAFKTADVDGIISANFPNPMGVQVNQMRQNGLDVPYIGGSSLSIAKDSGSISGGFQNLYVADDCVPDLNLNAAAKKFTKEYEDKYDVPPNYQAAKCGTRSMMAADAIDKAGAHDPAKINKAMQATNYKGICDYSTDKNNALAGSVYVYDYKADGSKKLLKTYTLALPPVRRACHNRAPNDRAARGIGACRRRIA